jgi:creatinine amidohydrolase/Fe(II)-dependent formamide hydrolase-like protein
MTFSEETLRPLFVEIFEQVEKVGWRVLLVLSGHYGACQVDFVKSVAKQYARKRPRLRIIAQPEYEGVKVDGELPCDHAGKWETSMFWRMYPELTHMENLKPGVVQVPQYEDPPHNVYKEQGRWEWSESLRQAASPELGQRAIDAITDHLKSLILSEMPTMMGQ